MMFASGGGRTLGANGCVPMFASGGARHWKQTIVHRCLLRVVHDIGSRRVCNDVCFGGWTDLGSKRVCTDVCFGWCTTLEADDCAPMFASGGARHWKQTVEHLCLRREVHDIGTRRI